jgi:hypothetical protein
MPIIQQQIPHNMAAGGGQLALENSFIDAQVPSFATNALPSNQTISNQQELAANTNSFPELNKLGEIPNTGSFGNNTTGKDIANKTAADILSKKEEIE